MFRRDASVQRLTTETVSYKRIIDGDACICEHGPSPFATGNPMAQNVTKFGRDRLYTPFLLQLMLQLLSKGCCIAMTLFSSSLATTTAASPKDSRRGRASVDGWSINLPTPQAAIAALIDAARAKQSFSCFTLNLDHLVWLRRSTEFRAAYGAARFVTADGAPVVSIARRQWPELQLTTGADLMLPLCDAAAQADVPIYLFGTSDEVLASIKATLIERTGGRLRVVGTEAPARGFDVDSSAANDALRRIKRSGAGLCFVLLGAPKQELFSALAVESGVPCGFVCVGAAADFIVGHQVRAPHAMRDLGLEWLWRLSHNPRRLGMRYLRCAMLFAKLELGYRVRSIAAPK